MNMADVLQLCLQDYNKVTGADAGYNRNTVSESSRQSQPKSHKMCYALIFTPYFFD